MISINILTDCCVIGLQAEGRREWIRKSTSTSFGRAGFTPGGTRAVRLSLFQFREYGYYFGFADKAGVSITLLPMRIVENLCRNGLYAVLDGFLSILPDIDVDHSDSALVECG